ncbi:MAG: DNA methyltransferase [Gammaproteobacteria bacterium]
MPDSPRRLMLDLPAFVQAALVAGARDSEPVRGLTHGYYKYPARFSPRFARAAIETFTRPADLVLDNHAGGGTTLVEALALGRHAIGVDISTLAEFVATVKTTVFDETEIDRIEAWACRLANAVHVRKSSIHFADYADLGYYKHLSHPSRWRLRKAIEQSLRSAMRLGSSRLEFFGRCVVLRTAQWALDGRKNLPSLDGFREMLTENAKEMLSGARQLSAAVKGYSHLPTVRVINRSAAGLEHDDGLAHLQSPRLVVTSPPYPGVHVLYHRWQVDGRKEASLPFMIANKLDGAGSSYYTMGDRKYPELKTYFDSIRASMSSVAALADKDTTIVQMVAFSDISWQLKRYLETMEEAGLSEVFLPMLEGERDGRLWRTVPGRRWYSDQRGDTPGSREVVIIHRKRGATPMRPRRRLRIGVHSHP